jgi:1-deoxyxylulose-5-phosphate synthase
MQFVSMGSTGAQVSRVCLGCLGFGEGIAGWGINEERSFAIIRAAVEAGINFFDTADVYGQGESERILGRALKELRVRREEIVVSTKVFGPMGSGPNRGGLSRKHLKAAIDASLQRLGLDYIDLYQIHRFDPQTPIEETVDALGDIVRAGKVLYVGASSMLTYQFAKFRFRAAQQDRMQFTMMQSQYSVLYREEEREMIPFCSEEGVGIICWGPLAGGRLAGSRESNSPRSRSKVQQTRFNRPSDQDVINAVNEVAHARGETAAQVAIAWLLSKPHVTAPIIGASRLEHLDAPLKALDHPLSEQEIRRLEAPYVAQDALTSLS